MLTPHNRKVEELKRILLKLNLPVLPLNTVKSGFYVCDVVTRIDTNFIPIDFINSHGQVAFDIGGLVLLSGKDIVDYSLAVISDKLWEKEARDFKIAKLNLPVRVSMIRFAEVEDWFTSKLGLL